MNHRKPRSSHNPGDHQKEGEPGETLRGQWLRGIKGSHGGTLKKEDGSSVSWNRARKRGMRPGIRNLHALKGRRVRWEERRESVGMWRAKSSRSDDSNATTNSTKHPQKHGYLIRWSSLNCNASETEREREREERLTGSPRQCHIQQTFLHMCHCKNCKDYWCFVISWWFER